MQSCHQTVNLTGASSSANHDSSSDLQTFAVNGLFDESSSIDYQMSLLSSSPICGAMQQKLNCSSPAKSANSSIAFGSQPVLLSELADCSPQGKNFLGNTLCSFISSFDNRRCTNLVTVSSRNERSYCKSHSKLLHSNDLKHTSTYGSTSGNLDVSCVRNLDQDSHTLAPVRDVQKTPGFVQNSVKKSYNDDIYTPRHQHGAASTSVVTGVDVLDGQFLQSNFTRSPTQNVVLPVSYLVSPNQLSKMNSGQISSKISSPQRPKVECNRTVQTLKTNQPVNYWQNASNSKINSKPVVMDGDVLQAFVDLLNQNHDRLTAQQQIEFLNSIGVTVATVKNPSEVSHLPPTKTQAQVKSITTQFQHTNSINDSAVSPGNLSHGLLSRNCSSQSITPTNALSTPGIKRKYTSNIQAPHSAKKTKLQNMTNVANTVQMSLHSDAQLTDGIVPLGEVSSTNSQKHLSPVTDNKKKLKSSPGFENNMWRKGYGRLPQVPTLPITAYRNHREKIMKEKISSKPLKEYVTMEISKELKNQNLFPLGPFCDDNDAVICKCPVKCVLQSTTKSRRKSTKATKLPRVCSRCKKYDAAHPNVNFANIVAKSISKARLNYYTLGQETDADMNVGLNSQETLEKLSAASIGKFPVSVCCRQLNRTTRLWKKLCRQENDGIKKLVEAARSNTTESAVLLKRLGTSPISCSRRRDLCASNLSQCQLTDRIGDQCTNTALPFSAYCREHILHSDFQLLYKLNANMSIVADIYPDPPVIKHRRKTKVPRLNRKKKRKVHRSTKNSSNSVKNFKQKQKAAINKINGHCEAKSTVEENPQQPTVSNCMIDDTVYDFVAETSSAKMPNIISDPKLPSKENILTESLPAVVDEESSSEMFEAFNLEGTELLTDMIPEVFSELGIFNVKNGEALDNALLLAGSVDFDPADKLDMDKVSGEDSLSDNGLLFPASTAERTNLTISSSLSDESYCDHLLKHPESDCIDSVFISQTLSNPTIATISLTDADTFPNVTLKGTQAATTANCTISWSSSEFENHLAENKLDVMSGKFSDLSSHDSSFIEDLNELEGVIQSLHDETIKNTVQPSNTGSQANVNAGNYPDILAKELTLDTENNNISLPDPSTLWNGEVHKAVSNRLALPPSSTSSYTPYVSVPSQTSTAFSSSSNFQNQPVVVSHLPSSRIQSNSSVSGSYTQRKLTDVSKAGQNPKQAKKNNKNKQSPKKRTASSASATLPITRLLPSLSENIPTLGREILPAGTCRKTNSTELLNDGIAVTRTTLKTAGKISTATEKPRNGKKARTSIAGYVSGSCQQASAAIHPFRVQPKVVPGSVLCTAGKLSNNVQNQSMVLIPINAMVRSTNSATVQGVNQSVGIAFAIPAHATFSSNLGTMIPIRGSAVLANTPTNGQQLLIVGGAPAINATFSSNATSNRNRSTPSQTTTTTTPKQPQQKSKLQNLGSWKIAASSNVKSPSRSSKVTIQPTAMKPSSTFSSYMTTSGVKAQNFSPLNLQQSISASVSTVVTMQAKAIVNKTQSVKSPTVSNQDSPLVMAPATNRKNSLKEPNHQATDAKATAVVGVTAPNKTVVPGKSNKGSSTVHWNQSMTGPDAPSPQPKAYGTIGGQTSNMLYCRRISPTLNNCQHVIVGRLGSLGRAGLSHLTVADQAKKSGLSSIVGDVHLPTGVETSAMTSDGQQTSLKTTAPLSAHGFIPLSPSVISSASSSLKPRLTSHGNQSQLNSATPASEKSTSGNRTKSTSASVSMSSRLSDTVSLNVLSVNSGNTSADGLKNTVQFKGQTVPVTNDTDTRLAMPAQLSVASQTNSAVKHNSRKSDHTLTLEDPDFCEQGTNMMATKLDTCNHSRPSTSTKGLSKNHVSAGDTALAAPLASSDNFQRDDDKLLLSGGKPTRRAAILRRR